MNTFTGRKCSLVNRLLNLTQKGTRSSSLKWMVGKFKREIRLKLLIEEKSRHAKRLELARSQSLDLAWPLYDRHPKVPLPLPSIMFPV